MNPEACREAKGPREERILIVVVMGVSGCGKTTVGRRLAGALRVPFHDADDYHPAENVEKMAGGRPLDDGDRIPWLRTLAMKMREWDKSGGAVLACSALKASYREILETGSSELRWVYLRTSRETIRNRVRKRPGHFMPSSLVDSQFEALEEPGPEAIVLDAALSPSVLMKQIRKQIDR